jgi:hypothetical protein
MIYLSIILNIINLVSISVIIHRLIKKEESDLKNTNQTNNLIKDNQQYFSEIINNLDFIQAELTKMSRNSQIPKVEIPQIKELNNLIENLSTSINQIPNESIQIELQKINIAISQLQKLNNSAKNLSVNETKITNSLKLFEIPKHSVCLFDYNSDFSEIIKKIKAINNIKDFLAKNECKESQIFLKNLKQYMIKIDKFEKKYKDNSLDEDEYSEELSSIFIKIIQRNFFDKLILSCYRGLNYDKHKKNFYLKLITYLMNYLKNINIYSDNYDKYITGQKYPYNMEFVDISISKTTETDKHETIKEVEMLPYFLNYFDENEEIDKYNIQGKMTIFSINGGL